MSASPDMDILIAQSPEELAEVYGFRYEVLVGQLGRTYVNADHENRALSDPADRAAMQIYMRRAGRIAATLRVIVAPVPMLPVYMRERFGLGAFDLEGLTVSFTDTLVVDTDRADSRAAAILMTAAYKIACARGSGFDFTNAAPGEVGVFERLGYRSYGANYQDADLGFRVPMVLPTGDLEHMTATRSPFLSLARTMKHDRELVNWFRRAFAEACNSVQPAAMDEEALWSYLTRKLNQTPHNGIPLLMALEYRDAARFLKLATVVKCGAGETIVKKGDMGNEMFVVLDGAVEVRDGDRRIARFGKGGIFGEMAYLNTEPRTADVVALRPAEILVLTQDTMTRAMTKMPDIAARILFNLSLILVERLKDTTGKYVKASETAAA
ncbi:hypothetical protein CVT23_02710 [Minwuia thermotolerans]|uniref:Cyclic nucleotide-binding domain-containing protein n=2 Tax=Minwuia thermotolerans TaxID=2056226 RepID=A0A2M9G632_9PROT|nr:hypothetical protein CVT23_02710 [Minwuia thermotolerans]